MSQLKFSIMITTRNRLKDLKVTCNVISKLQPAPSEVIITADGCTDGTSKYIQTAFPEFRLIINEVGKGSVASRALMMNEAKGDLVLALDDDSYPEQINCLNLLATLFMRHSNLAVATFPQRTDEYPKTLTQKDFGKEKSVHSFPNSGACFRMTTYRKLPGFEPLFFHMYEEPDYALQCIANGWEVKYFPIITIRHHFSSVRRNEIRNHHLHSRNEFWSAVIRCPLPYLPFITTYRVISQLFYASSRGPNWLIVEPKWWWWAIQGLPHILKKRQPLSWTGYKLWLLSSR